jgi:hypothetical protein
MNVDLYTLHVLLEDYPSTQSNLAWTPVIVFNTFIRKYTMGFNACIVTPQKKLCKLSAKKGSLLKLKKYDGFVK